MTKQEEVLCEIMNNKYTSLLAQLDAESTGFAQVINTINNAVLQEGESKTIAEYAAAWEAMTKDSIGMN